MKIKTKKLLISAGAVVATTFPILTIVSCTGEKNVEAKMDEIVIVLSPTDSVMEGTPEVDPSATGSSSEGYTSNLFAGLGRLTTSGRNAGTSDKNTGDWTWNVKAKNAAKFEAADSLEIFLDDKPQGIISNNDISEKVYPSKPISTSTSFNKIVFNIANAKWVNFRGEETGDEVTNKDFIYGFLRKLFEDKTLRKNAITPNTWQLDKTKKGDFVKAINNIVGIDENTSFDFGIKSIPYFTGMNAHSSYLLDLFKIDIIGTLEANEKESKKFTIKFKGAPTKGAQTKGAQTKGAQTKDDQTKGIQTDFSSLKRIFKGGTISSFFLPVNSKQIKRESKKLTDISSKIGFYTFGKDNETTTYNGAYYASVYNWKTKEEYLKNKHYVDKAWAKSNKTIRRIEIIKRALDSSIKASSLMSLYNEGITTSISLSTLNQEQRYEILDKHRDDIFYKKPSTVNPGLFTRQDIWSPLATIGASLKQDKDLLNLIGVSTSNNETGIKINTSSINFLSDEAIHFRRLMAESINPWAWARAVDDDKRPWVSTVNPGYLYNGKEVINNKKLSNRHRVGTNGVETPTLAASKQAFLEAGSEAKRWRSKNYEEYKKEMKELLDKYFQNHPNSGGKINIKLLPGGTITDENKKQSLIQWKSALEGLDSYPGHVSRIKVEIKTLTNNNDYHRNYFPTYLQTTNIWGADIAEMNSQVTGWFQAGGLGLSLLKLNSAYDNASHTFSSASKNTLIKTMIDYANSKGNTTKDLLSKINIKDVFKEEFNYSGGAGSEFKKYIVPENNKDTSSLLKKFTSGYAKYFFDMEHSINGSEKIKEIVVALNDSYLTTYTPYGVGSSIITDPNTPILSIVKWSGGKTPKILPAIMNTDSQELDVWEDYVRT